VNTCPGTIETQSCGATLTKIGEKYLENLASNMVCSGRMLCVNTFPLAIVADTIRRASFIPIHTQEPCQSQSDRLGQSMAQTWCLIQEYRSDWILLTYSSIGVGNQVLWSTYRHLCQPSTGLYTLIWASTGFCWASTLTLARTIFFVRVGKD